jgi:drug/metabolite transporter (DMT)-like permease
MSRRGWLAFAAMSSIWGVPYLFIKIAVDGGAPFATVAWARVTLAAAVLLALAAHAGVVPALRGKLRWVVAYGIVEIAVPFPLIAFGEQRLPSSMAAILIASVPLMIALLSLRYDHGERPTAARLSGLLIGFAGVVTLVGFDVSQRPGELPGVLAILGAAAGYAVGPLILKRHLIALDPRATMGASLAVAAVVLAPLAAITAPARLPSAGALASIAVLGLLCTALAFVIFNTLIAETGPARASVITYVNPVVAVGLGVALLGEQPGAGTVAGLLLILAGSWLSTDGRLPPGLRRLRAERGAPSGTPETPGWAGRLPLAADRLG